MLAYYFESVHFHPPVLQNDENEGAPPQLLDAFKVNKKGAYSFSSGRVC